MRVLARSALVGSLLASVVACGTLLAIGEEPPSTVESGAPLADASYADGEGGGFADAYVPDGGVDGSSGTKRPIAFVTTMTSNANFPGVGGANQICSAAAVAAGLPGNFRAYLQLLGGFDAEGRLVDAGTFYRVDGKPIFDSFPPLAAKLPFLTEQGQELASDAGAWTGIGNQTCSDWTAIGEVCQMGRPSSASGTQWRSSGTAMGSAELHVYCFGD